MATRSDDQTTLQYLLCHKRELLYSINARNDT